MKINFKSLRTRLFLWYIGSLIILALYFYLIVHILQLPYATDFFFVLLAILVIAGYFIVSRITRSLTYLSSRMKLISSKNLDDRILDIRNENEIGELAFTFNSLLDRLSDSFKRERQFIADVAHELKTPLSTMKSSLEIALTRDRTNDDYKKVIEEALLETDQLSLTLKNVLDLAWSETPSEIKSKKRFNLSQLIDDLYEIAQKMALKKKIGVKLTTRKNIFISGFKDKLARALLNIIDNALKFSPNGGKIELLLEKTPKKVLFSVIDNGAGISKEEVPHIFDRFYRGSKTDNILGAGLGLAIAQSIVNLHRGQIKVKSAIGEGSTLVVVLPLSS